jgi:hypothetical protein
MEDPPTAHLVLDWGEHEPGTSVGVGRAHHGDSGPNCCANASGNVGHPLSVSVRALDEPCGLARSSSAVIQGLTKCALVLARTSA